MTNSSLNGANDNPLADSPSAPPPPSSIWHPERPGLQVVWDATSLSKLLACPEQYRLSQIEGWRVAETRVDLEFGHIVGGGLERFYKGVIEQGMGHDAALLEALRWALTESWDHACNGPKFGAYVPVWRCNGDEPFRNEKGNRAKCPFAHLSKPPFASPPPKTCGRCGGTIATWEQWVPAEPPKDRLAILRAIVAYSEEMRGGSLKPVSYGPRDSREGHRALLEMHFAIPFVTVQGVQFWLAGWFDKVAAIGDDRTFITDYKTTRNTMGALYWSQFEPNVQVGLYNLVGPYALPEGVREHFAGVAIEAIQVLGEGVRHGFRVYTQDDQQALEFGELLATTIGTAVGYHTTQYYPRNPTACRMCSFRPVCAATPAKRAAILAERFVRARWNPLTRTTEPVEVAGAPVAD